MAVYEPDRGRIVLRVVYDGPGRAGKTTNVEQLAGIFGDRPGNELLVHPAATGRTIFFDWFSFDGGMIDGHPLQVQVVTVPGHKSLEPRRAHILHTADVVVLVCDSAAPGQDAAREMLDSLREHLGSRAEQVPLIVQANKQDLASAVSPPLLGAALGLGHDTTVVGAQAATGVGVRETAIGAIRAGVRQMKRVTGQFGMNAITGRAGSAQELRASLERIEASRVGRSAPERRKDDEVRAEVQAGLVDEGRVVYIGSHELTHQRVAGDRAELGTRGRTTLQQSFSDMSEKTHSERPRRSPVPVSAMFLDPRPANDPPDLAASATAPDLPPVGAHAGDSPLARDFAAAEAELGAPDGRLAAPDPPALVVELADVPTAPPALVAELADAPTDPPALVAELADAPTAPPPPLRPGPDVPPGHVWPVPGGRAVLEQIAGHDMTQTPCLEGHALESMSFKAGGHRLQTRGEWRFGERERGREALIAHVRRTARLGPLLPAGIAVALATTDADADAAADEVVLWHVVPDLPSLGAALTAATEAERPRQLTRLAAAYAAALRLVAREGIVLTLDPHAFAEQDGRWVYLGDRLGEPERSPDLVGALLAPCAGLSEASRAAWQTALEQVLPATLTREDVAALGLERALTASATVPARAAEARARDRLRMTLGLCT